MQKRKNQIEVGIIWILTLVILALPSCYKNIDTFYNVNKGSVLGGKTNKIIDYPGFTCNGLFSLYGKEDVLEGICLTAEFNNKGVVINSFNFSIHPHKFDVPEQFDSIMIVDKSTNTNASASWEKALDKINESEFSTIVFYFRDDVQDYDSLYLVYNIGIKYNNIDSLISGKEVFIRGSYKQSLSR